MSKQELRKCLERQFNLAVARALLPKYLKTFKELNRKLPLNRFALVSLRQKVEMCHDKVWYGFNIKPVIENYWSEMGDALNEHADMKNPAYLQGYVSLEWSRVVDDEVEELIYQSL